MKTFKIAAAIVAASISAFTIAPALAEVSAVSLLQGHYAWHAVSQYGPRTPLQAPRRVWILDGAQDANCDCGMMKMSSAESTDCMKAMLGMAPASGASAS